MSRSKKHECIGMTLNFSAPGQVSVSMPNYVGEIIGAFEKAAPDELGTKSSTIYLFQDEDAEKLPPEKGKEFQNLVAKILCATKKIADGLSDPPLCATDCTSGGSCATDRTTGDMCIAVRTATGHGCQGLGPGL